MEFVVVVKFSLSKPYDHWVKAFDDHQVARQGSGIKDIFRHPVIGEQSVVYAVRTSNPRAVHDMIYGEERAHIEESGFVVGSEIINVCEPI